MGHGISHGIQVKYDRPNLIYYAGERVTGNFSFENTKDNLKLKDSYLHSSNRICARSIATADIFLIQHYAKRKYIN